MEERNGNDPALAAVDAAEEPAEVSQREGSVLLQGGGMRRAIL